MGPSEGGCHYLHYLHHSLVSDWRTGREQPCPLTENWIKDLLRMTHLSEQDPVSPTVSLSHQETSISLFSLELTHWKRPWCWEWLKAGQERDDRGWDSRMASLIRWTWVWVSSGCWWWIGKTGMLQSMGSPRVRHDWATELNWNYPSEGRQNKNHNHRKLIKVITYTTAMSSSMKLRVMPCRATKQTGHGGEFWQHVVRWRRE